MFFFVFIVLRLSVFSHFITEPRNPFIMWSEDDQRLKTTFEHYFKLNLLPNFHNTCVASFSREFYI